MGDGTSGAYPTSGNPGNSASPLRIFTRVNSNGGALSGEQTPDEASPRPRETTNALLNSAFSQPYDEPGNAAGRPPASARPSAKAAPRVGRHGAHYHPLPSHWREHESGSSGVGSPVTPEGAGDDMAGVSRTVGPYVGASSQTLQNSMQGGAKAPRSFHSPRDYYNQGKAKTTGQSPIVSPRLHIGTLREAFGSASSLEWTNDRPGSSYSCQSTDQTGPGYVSEIQAESPLDIPAHGGRFPPPLSSMAARPGAGRGALASHTGSSSRHHPSASTSSSHYSLNVSSPPSRNAGPAAGQFSAPKEAMHSCPMTTSSRGASSEAHGLQGEDIVRKYLGLQRRAVSATNSNVVGNVGSSERAADVIPRSHQLHMQKKRQQHRLSSTPSISAFPLQELPSQVAPTLPTSDTVSTSPDDASSGSIVFRRAVSSGDLPTLDGPSCGSLSNASVADSRSFLTPDLVESPLEALVRRLTIELFQLYVNEDRKKAAEMAQSQSPVQGQHPTSTVKSNATSQFAEEDEFVLVGERRPSAIDSSSSIAAAVAPAALPGDGFIQQFRLGPSLRSGSNTPAVTMDGYFDPQATNTAEAGADSAEVRPRPRHRLLQRTWMEEALIKARRVSTIDENAEEAILQGLDQEAIGSSPLLAPNMLAATSDMPKTLSPLSGEDLSQFSLESTMPPRIAQRGQALGASGAGTQGSPQHQGSAEGMWLQPGRVDLAALGEEPSMELPAPGMRSDGQPGFVAGGASHVMSPRGFYRARDPAAPHRKLPAERRVKGQMSSGISPARASLIRAVGRRQSVRLQPGKGQIVVAETHVSARGSASQGSASAASVSLEPDAAARAKRANSLPGLMQVPETREVSYADQQRKAARAVAMEKAPKSRARIVHRAERMVLGGTQPASQRTDDGHGVRKRHTHKRAGSRADMDQQLLTIELPPPVPLRVRREQVKMVPEPLIIVRRPAKKPRAEDSRTPEERILRVHNQLLGAQAVLSRHNSVMRHMPLSVPGSGTATPRAGAGLTRGLAARSAGPAGPNAAARMSMQAVVQKEALDVMMLDNALEDHIVDDEKQRFAEAKQRRRQVRQEVASDTGDSESGLNTPWRNSRRRSTLRKKDRPQIGGLAPVSAASDALASKAAPSRGRRLLLLHGPAYRIYSGIRARPDTYLFLFTDMLVVTTRLGLAASSHAVSGIDHSSIMVMAPPSADANIIPADSRFKVHIVIPLARSTTSLKTTREGSSKRPNEDEEAEEKRLVRQEERIRRACLVFEKNTSEAVVYLINREIIEPVPDTVAGFLYRCTALSRRQIGNFLGTGILGENLHENPTADEVEQEKLFHRQIWTSFLDRCNIVGVPIDEALRSVLFYVRLPNSPMSISVLLEIAALQWYSKNVEHAQSSKVYVPESQDMAVKLAFAIMTLNTELHNPLLRTETQPEAAYRELVLKFRASVVDDPAVAGKRKGNVLRKRDQPRVMTIMEVPAEILKAIFERVSANRLVTCSDARPAAAEFDIEWIRDISDANAPPLTDEQVENEIEDVYCDSGFRDGVLFNASSDRLPAKFNVDPPAWLRVTVRIPEADPKLTINIRALSVPAEPSASANAGSDVVTILPSSRLSFRASNTASFVIRPQQVGHFTLHFISEGSHARYYHPIPSRTMVVEGVFMRQTVQLAWKRADEQQGHRARHMFGMDSQPTKSHWVRCIDAALKGSADVPSKDILRSVERATQALAALDPSSQAAANDRLDQTAAAGTVASRGGTVSGSGALDQSISCLQLLGALGGI
ncbi:hypothetical protein IWW37_000253 [Coemansia sp. RSA 2050]|nr:hypothetical protein IWW37_000253 [Coemansia sp. RSA 2050]